MGSDGKNGSRLAFGDLTNVHTQGADATSDWRPKTIDPKELKRQRERARSSAMTVEQRDARNKRRREDYARKKGQITGSNDVGVAGPFCHIQSLTDMENIPPADVTQIDGCMEHVRSSTSKMLPDVMDVDQDNDWLHTSENYMRQGVELDPDPNVTGPLGEDLVRDTLITYGNTDKCYTPEKTHDMSVHDDGDADVVLNLTEEVSQPRTDFHGTPPLLDPWASQVDDLQTPVPEPCKSTQRQHVTPGEKGALLARQNQRFETCIARKARGNHQVNDVGRQQMSESTVIDQGRWQTRAMQCKRGQNRVMATVGSPF
ncbi:uncharacterized protein C2845_PM03G21140 [Panicum miliaceum]|uniref:Uncharacterized protein n=1 Tax=Panicum miliaceum TaxID=4540 RepID=A0A3L6T899_PANMI|nr:uncharacterized protein C2845_PM03G21140 [Panicum miliaceum]